MESSLHGPTDLDQTHSLWLVTGHWCIDPILVYLRYSISFGTRMVKIEEADSVHKFEYCISLNRRRPRIVAAQSKALQ